MSKTAFLILENGKVFKGKSFGAEGEVTAEVVFTTGMTGYLEALADQSYYGQMIVHTFPLIGNYGVITQDFENERVLPKAYIVKEWCHVPSNFRSTGDIDTFLREKNIVGLYGIDTRTLTKTIRDNGVMNGRISASPDGVDLQEIKNYKNSFSIENLPCGEYRHFPSEGASHTVALIDYGLKNNLRKELNARGCGVTVCPATTGAKELAALKVDGVVLSDGPGNPAEYTKIIERVKEYCGMGVPIFGVCLGHQLLAQACGMKISKLKYGHRGANHPVKDLKTGRVYITSQNHAYTVETGKIDEKRARMIYQSLNDMTCEGIEYKTFPGFSVQFYPKDGGGPQDLSRLFDRFIHKMEVISYAP